MKTAYFLLNEECNLNCIHCIRGIKKKVSLKLSDYMHIIDELETFFPDSLLVLTGGEPTLNKFVYDILEYALSKNFIKIMFLSNGTTNEIIPLVNKFQANKKLVFQFSIDGDIEEHNKIRGNGTFEQLIDNIQKINDLGVPIYISSVVTKQNISSYRNLHNKLCKFNIKQWHINPVHPFGFTDDVLVLDTLAWNSFVEDIKSFSKLKLSIHKMYNFSNCMNCSYEEILGNKEKFKDITNCMTVKNKIYVYPDGNVYGCTCLKDFPLGNILEQKLDDILNSTNAMILKNYTIKNESPCYSCKFKPICNGGCIGMSYHVFKELGMGDNRCPLFQIKK